MKRSTLLIYFLISVLVCLAYWIITRPFPFSVAVIPYWIIFVGLIVAIFCAVMEHDNIEDEFDDICFNSNSKQEVKDKIMQWYKESSNMKIRKFIQEQTNASVNYFHEMMLENICQDRKAIEKLAKALEEYKFRNF